MHALVKTVNEVFFKIENIPNKIQCIGLMTKAEKEKICKMTETEKGTFQIGSA